MVRRQLISIYFLLAYRFQSLSTINNSIYSIYSRCRGRQGAEGTIRGRFHQALPPTSHLPSARNEICSKPNPPMASSPPPSPTPTPPPLPIPASTSILFQNLPYNSTVALHRASALPASKAQPKILVRFKPVGSAPALAKPIWKIDSSKPFSKVVRTLRDQLRKGGSRVGEGEEVFAYVNSTFAPGLDEEVGMLFEVCLDEGRGRLYMLTWIC